MEYMSLEDFKDYCRRLPKEKRIQILKKFIESSPYEKMY
jgi:hypothetical protein